MSAIVVIPARYSSTRFPGKPLALLKGLPVIQHVYRNAARSSRASDVIVATDSETIFNAVCAFGGKAVMTSGDHESGTDRIAEVSRSLDCDIIVNVQGDEPLIRPEMIDEVISLLDDEKADIGTLAVRIRDRREITDPNVVKVVFNSIGTALYFSRAPVPYHRDLFGRHLHGGQCSEDSLAHPAFSPDLPEAAVAETYMFKHVGIYSFRRVTLLKFSSLPPSRLETLEKLEQLRALENGYVIKVKETEYETSGVDTPEDLERIEKCLNSSL